MNAFLCWVLVFPLLLLFLAAPALAQPFAPITWGQPYQVATFPIYDDTWQFFSKGDTLINLGTFQVRWGEFPKVKVSVDDGRSWRPFHYLIDSTMNDDEVTPALPRVRYTDNTLYVISALNASYIGLWRSLDWGLSWSCRRIPSTWLRCDANLDDTLFFIHQDYNNNHPRWYYTYSVGFNGTLTPLQLLPRHFILSATHNRIYLGGNSDTHDTADYGMRLYYSQIDRATGIIAPVRQLNTDLYFNSETTGRFDDEGYGFYHSGTDTLPPLTIQRYTRVTINNTTDGGQTFSRQYLNQLESAIVTYEEAFRNKIAVMSWLDTVVQAPFTRPFEWFAFSANRAQSFYPSQQFHASTIDQFAGGTRSIEIRPNSHTIRVNYTRLRQGDSVRVYSIVCSYQPDFECPLLDSVLAIPAECTPQQLIPLAVSGFDNDSLWRIGLVTRRIGFPDSQFVRLTRGASGNFVTEWTAPSDSGRYVYYYFAEDMWENRGYWQTTFPDQPDTFIVVASSVSQATPAIPSELLRIFPNPGNNEFTISYPLKNSKSSGRIEIFDLSGRLVFRYDVPIQSSQNRIVWNGSNRKGIRVASGVYYCRFTIQSTIYSTKFVVLR